MFDSGIRIDGDSGGGVALVSEGNFTPCPKGHTAQILDGGFSVRSGVIEVITAAPWTRDKLAEFYNTLTWAIENFEERPDEVVQTLSRQGRVSPFIQRMLFETWSRSDVLAALALLAAVVGLILGQAGGGDTAVYNFNDVDVNEAINECPAVAPDEVDAGLADPPTPPLESRTPTNPTGGAPRNPPGSPATELPQ